MSRISPYVSPLPSTSRIRLWSVLIAMGLSLPAFAAPSGTNTGVELSLADLMDLQIVQSAGFFAVDRRLAPGNSYLIDREEMRKYGLTTISQILNRKVPGVNISYHAFSMNTMGVRGVVVDVNAKTLMLRDNVNTNFRSHYGIQGAELNSPLTGDLDRIEVTTGPGAILHGSGAISGFINQISATGESRPGLWARGSYGDGNAVTAEASYGKVYGEGNDLFLYGGFYSADGVEMNTPIPLDQYDSIAKAPGDPSATYWKNAKIGANAGDPKISARYRFGTEQDFASLDFKAMFQQASLNPTAAWWHHNSQQSWVRELAAMDSGNTHLNPYHTITSKTLMIAPEFIFRPMEKTSISITPSFLAKAVLVEPTDDLLNAEAFERKPAQDSIWADIRRTNDSINVFQKQIADSAAAGKTSKSASAKLATAQRLLQSQQARYATPFLEIRSGIGETQRGVKVVVRNETFENHKFAIGSEVSQKIFTGNNTFFGDENIRLFEAPLSFDWTDFSVFAEDMATYGPLSASAGIRYDFTSFGILELPTRVTTRLENVDNFVGRVAAAWTITEDHIVKASWQQGYRFADAFLYRKNFEDRLKNPKGPQLRPEKSNNFEAGMYSRFLGGKLNLDATGFYNIYNDMLGFITEPNYTFGNSDTTFTTTGGEFGARYRPIEALEFEGSYSYSQPLDSYDKDLRIANKDNTWTKYPSQMVKLGISGAFKGLDFGTTGRYRNGAYVKDVDPTNAKLPFTTPALVDIYERNEFTVDASLGYTFGKDIRVGGTVENLWHNDYQNLDYYGGQALTKAGLRAENPLWKLILECKL